MFCDCFLRYMPVPHAIPGLASAQLYCCGWHSTQGLALLAKNGILAVCVQSVHVINRIERNVMRHQTCRIEAGMLNLEFFAGMLNALLG